MFKWVALGAAVVAVVILGWMVNDLRVQAKRPTVTVNEKLPEILERSTPVPASQPPCDKPPNMG